ncbi:MAG: methyltransferase domain-containing protein [Verrucomicrobia bacterium]|nr:methyltransferase domain-containing protein [Verrucomicrobiota bacterium]
MLSFTHRGQSVSLHAGEAWTPAVTEETYRDAPAKELWEIVKSIRAGQPWREVVASRYAKSNPWLHQIVTSPKRDLFFREHPPKPGAKVLDIGSGWGQIALPLARDTHAEVVALEPTPERLAFIQAVAQQEGTAKRMNFIQGDFFDIAFGHTQSAPDSSVKRSPVDVSPSSPSDAHEVRPSTNAPLPIAHRPSPIFDLVTCVGVLEWVPKFRSGNPRDVQIEFLQRARSLLAPGGQLVIGIENRLGLKYLLGAPDDHIGPPNIAVYDATLASEKWLKQSGQPLRSFTFTRAELTELLSAAGFGSTTFYAALPDYKLPELILPLGTATNDHFATGKYIPEHDGCNGHPLAIQSELRSHYRSLAHLGIASDFAPSFFVVTS